MRAVYLQSVHSPRQHNTLQRDVARYRQRREVSHWRNVYSQPCDSEDEHDDYLEDSFCVGNNVIEIPGEPVCLHVSLSVRCFNSHFPGFTNSQSLSFGWTRSYLH